MKLNALINKDIGLYFIITAVKMIRKSEMGGDILMTGGGAMNIGLRRAFEDELMRDVFVANYPQFNGAIGAALIACERGRT